MMKLDKRDGLLLVSFAGALLTGCPVVIDDTDDEGSEEGASDEDNQDTGDDGNTSSNTTLGMDGTSNDTGPQMTTDDGPMDTSTTTVDGTDGSDGSSEDTTAGVELCDIMLPPPGKCTMDAPENPPPMMWIAGEWPVPANWQNTNDIVDDDEPAAGGVSFIMDPDGGGVPIECSTYDQDCPAGEKCMPWANDGGGSWNATRCAPLDANPNQVGEDCTVEGSGVSGIDNCDIGQMCWDVDPETNMGVCIELCTCSPINPICETDNTSCVITNDGVLNLCLPVCNPVDPEACADGQGCYPAGDLFFCAPDVSGGPGETGQGDPCEFINACPGGMGCVSSDVVPGCAGVGCCSTFCNEDADCPASLTCTPWYEDGAAPDDCLGMTGICTG